MRLQSSGRPSHPIVAQLPFEELGQAHGERPGFARAWNEAEFKDGQGRQAVGLGHADKARRQTGFNQTDHSQAGLCQGEQAKQTVRRRDDAVRPLDGLKRLHRHAASDVPGFEQGNGQWIAQWQLVSAGSIIAALPPVLMFFLMQKHFIAGLTLGATKG